MSRPWGRRPVPRALPADVTPLRDEGLRAVVVELTTEMIAWAAPAERALFAADTEAFLAQPGVQPTAGKDSPLGFGVGDVDHLLAPEVVFAAWVAVSAAADLVAEAARDAAKEVIAQPLADLVRRVFHLRTERQTSTDLPAESELADLVRRAVEEHLRRRRLPEGEIAAITEALMRRLFPPGDGSAR